MDDGTTIRSFSFAESFAGGAESDSMGDGGAKKYFGKYRGTVVNNVDPKKMGRIQVQVPDVIGLGVTGWAMPCMPFGGPETGTYVVPAIGAGVWVEFEQGNPSHPIAVGYWWGSTAEVPKTAIATVPGIPVVVTQTPLQNVIVISDGPTTLSPEVNMSLGGIGLRSGGSSLTVGPEGVTIKALKIDIDALQINFNGTYLGEINFNRNALKILP